LAVHSQTSFSSTSKRGDVADEVAGEQAVTLEGVTGTPVEPADHVAGRSVAGLGKHEQERFIDPDDGITR
jgi:hypothetical protein